MTRKQAEKIADAIRVVAEQSGEREWTTKNITVTDVAAVLKKRRDEVEAGLKENGAMVWGCMPFGWRFRVRGAEGIEVSRPARS